MKPFRFEPKLFEHRARAINIFAEEGLLWLTHFSSVDIVHDLFGLEVCGIEREDDAFKIESLLHVVFPEWRYSRVDYKGAVLDRGWKVVIHRDSEIQKG